MVKQLAAVTGLAFSLTVVRIAGSHDNNLPFSQETATPQPFHMISQATGHAFQVWSFFLFGCVGEVEIVHLIQGLNT